MRLPRNVAAASIGIAALLSFSCMSQQERAALLAGPYTVQVDYSAGLDRALGAGHYSWVNSQVIPSNFAGSEAGQATLSAVLVPFPPKADQGYVLGSPAVAGMRPATLRELLAFGQAYPGVQEKLPVLALGSSASLEVVTYDHVPVNGGTQTVMLTIRRVERVYPFLADGLPGRTVGLEWLDDPAGYGMYYALFVKPQ
jgi:hypothetical protein